jgi:hypothetical protein
MPEVIPPGDKLSECTQSHLEPGVIRAWGV